jgi:rhomboid protease GluP
VSSRDIDFSSNPVDRVMSSPDGDRRQLDGRPANAPVVPVLIALNVLMFTIMATTGAGILVSQPEAHVLFGSNIGALTWNGEPWRLLTSAFLHSGLLHLVFNMCALFIGGRLTERLYGSGRVLVIYLLSALAGSVVSGWWNPDRNSVGASGAVLGVYGALLVYFALRRHEIPSRLFKPAGWGALLLCGYTLATGTTNPQTDNACHVGGLLGGMAAGLLLARPLHLEMRREGSPGYLALVVAIVCAALALLSLSLWSSGGGRHLQIVALGEIRRFASREQSVIDRFLEIAKTVQDAEQPLVLERQKLAGSRLEAEVLPQWRDATRSVLAIDAAAIDDAKLGRKLRLLQSYMKHRDQAMTMTAAIFNGSQAYTLEELQAEWQRAQSAVGDLARENPANQK